jgi:hypothetical protein
VDLVHVMDHVQRGIGGRIAGMLFVQPLNIWTSNFRELSHARGELQLLIDDWILDYNYSFIDM